MTSIPTSPTEDHVITRSEATAAALKHYHDETLQLLKPTWQKILTAVAPITAAFLFLFVEPMVAAAVFLPVTGTSFVLARRLLDHDREIRLRASLTPVFDMGVLRGQISVVSAACQFLRAAAPMAQTDPCRLKEAVQVMFTALGPLLARGPTTIENATVPGYKAYPEVEVMSMPDDDTDLISFHLIRLDASLIRLNSLAQSDGVIAETISFIAGEFVPPLRAIEAQL